MRSIRVVSNSLYSR